MSGAPRRVEPGDDVLEESVEDLYEHAPCGYLSCRPDGTIVKVNRTFATWTGFEPAELLGRRFPDLLSAAGRIYHETHFAPLLQMQGAVREIALEVVRRDGTRLPALVNASRRADEAGHARLIRLTVFDATDRRRYEQELLRSRRREQQIAQELQRSLLAGERPSAPELEIDVFYRPAIAGLEVGGDWHDAFWVEDRSLALVVGDVVGRGIGAAATMGQLRSAVRALALTGLPPGAMLEALDRFAARHAVGRMTTVVYAQLDLDTRQLRYACAGHPPPVLLSAGGDARFLGDARSLPLDAGVAPRSRPDAAVELEPGSTLLLYTDGLVERRTSPLAVRLERLLDELRSAARPLSLPALARRMEDQADADDVCLLSAVTRD